MKNIVTVVLLVFVAASIAYLAIGDRRSSNEATLEARTGESSSSDTARVGTTYDVASRTATERTDGAIAPTTVTGEEAAESHATAVDERSVIAHYFHRTQRCHTCLTMEAYARAALEEGLSDALQSGELQFRSVNVEEPANDHLVTEYELYASALVMVEMKGDEVKRSKKLEQILCCLSRNWTFPDPGLAFPGGGNDHEERTQEVHG